MLDETEFFECKCYSDEHTLKFIYDEERNEIYTSIFLNQYRNIFKRINVAIKYIFGYKCKYGHWDVWILINDDSKRLIELLKKIKKES